MVMIFTLVTAVQEKLNEIVDQIKVRRDEDKRRKEREAEEAEKVVLLYRAPPTGSFNGSVVGCGCPQQPRVENFP